VAKMRIGIQTGQDSQEWSSLLEFWKFLDQRTRFDSAWTIDHFVPPGAGQDPNGSCTEGWTALAALAQATERLRVGCLVTGVTYRHPSVLAKMAATVDHISNGRMEFGLGAAWHEMEHRVYGIPFPSVKERQDRLEEATELTKLLFTAEGPVDFEGKHYQLKQAPFSPKCVQTPHAPIFIGGGGEKRTLRTAARFADAINVSGSVNMVKHKIDVLRRHCADVGRDPSEIETSVFGVLFLTDDEQRAESMRGAMAAGMAGGDAEEAKRGLAIGNAEHVLEVMGRYAEAGASNFIMMSRSPYKQELYQRVSDEIIAPLS
jgi:F420-dependent oxidoreductase-like protein